MPPTNSQRWLDLLALLLGRTIPLTVEEIMERVPGYAEKWRTGDATKQATARRTFERDKDDLRAAGVPLEPLRYSVNWGAEQIEGYRLAHGDFYLPYLKVLASESPGSAQASASVAPPAAEGTSAARSPAAYRGLATVDLSAEEAELALEALRRTAVLPAFPFAADARSARRKLEFDLQEEQSSGDPVLWAERPGSAEVLERLRILSDALLARKRLSFRYHGIHRGSPTERDVEPYGLFFQREWYLVARDPAVDALRIFRVSRLEAPRLSTRAPKSPDYDIPADFSVRDHLDRSAWELGEQAEPLEVEVRFRFPLALHAARNGEGELLREEEDGSSIRLFRVSRRGPFLRWILSLSGEADIVAPTELREEMSALVGQVAALYAAEGPNGG